MRAPLIFLLEHLITLVETNGSHYDYEEERERERKRYLDYSFAFLQRGIHDERCNRRYFFPVLENGTGYRGREGEENNLKAELNFSSSESFVRALGGGQWLNGDVSRKVDSRERPVLYRPPIHSPLASHLPLREHERASARSYIVAKKYILEKERGLCMRRFCWSRPASGVPTSKYCYKASRYRHGNPLI